MRIQKRANKKHLAPSHISSPPAAILVENRKDPARVASPSCFAPSSLPSPSRACSATHVQQRIIISKSGVEISTSRAPTKRHQSTTINLFLYFFDDAKEKIEKKLFSSISAILSPFIWSSRLETARSPRCTVPGNNNERLRGAVTSPFPAAHTARVWRWHDRHAIFIRLALPPPPPLPAPTNPLGGRVRPKCVRARAGG